MVVQAIENSAFAEGKIAASYAREVAGKAIPLVTAGKLQSAHAVLLSEFPHARATIHALLGSLAEDHAIRIRPTIIVGDPGNGKSHFCKRFMETIGPPYTMIPFAGVN